MTEDHYGMGYYEFGLGSNYTNYLDDPGWDPTAEILARYAPTGSRLLEVACAKGYFVQAALRVGFDAWGMDISSYAVSKAPQGVAGRLTVGNGHDLPWADGEFEVVCSWEFLEHVPVGESDRVLDEMVRVLRPGGLLVNRIGLSDTADAGPPQRDTSHVNEAPRSWWEARFGERGLLWHPALETALTLAFRGRDWHERFFAWRLPDAGPALG